MKHPYRLACAALGLTILLGACGPLPTTVAPVLPNPVPGTPTATAAISETPIPIVEEPTSAPPVEIVAASSPTELPIPLSTATVAPIQLFFPTVIPAEGAEYRPPLYPIPWALSPYDHFYFTRPISAYYPASPVEDYRYGGIYFGPDTIHTGIDLPAPSGTSVLAAGSGTVVWAGVGLFTKNTAQADDPYGLAVAIRHNFGYDNQPLFTIYAHMSEVEVALGQWVNTGDEIGKVGSTGMATGPHLHFEVRLGDDTFYTTRNPELWISPPQGYGILAGRVMDVSGFLRNSFMVNVINKTTKREYSVLTYAALNVHSDSYYGENFVLGDLPAGIYELYFPLVGKDSDTTIQILPGQVTFFAYYGRNGYDFSLPAPPVQPTSTPVPTATP